MCCCCSVRAPVPAQLGCHRTSFSHAGSHLGDMPPANNLPPSLRRLPPPPPLIQDSHSSLPALSQLLSSLSGADQSLHSTRGAAHHPQVSLGHGMPSLPKKVVDRIISGEFIDFADLPPAKGRVRSLPTSEGSIILVQAADLLQKKRLLPDLATWMQCFALYASVICSQAPDRLADLMGYMCQIARASQRFKWPSWVIYDQNFRQDAADQRILVWARLDPGLFSQCFTGQAKNSEAWCRSCHSVDHGTDSCPLKPLVTPPPPKRSRPSSAPTTVVCRKFNRLGNCPFGSKCRYAHRCSLCGGEHPLTQCPKKQSVPTSKQTTPAV